MFQSTEFSAIEKGNPTRMIRERRIFGERNTLALLKVKMPTCKERPEKLKKHMLAKLLIEWHE